MTAATAHLGVVLAVLVAAGFLVADEDAIEQRVQARMAKHPTVSMGIRGKDQPEKLTMLTDTDLELFTRTLIHEAPQPTGAIGRHQLEGMYLDWLESRQLPEELAGEVFARAWRISTQEEPTQSLRGLVDALMRYSPEAVSAKFHTLEK